MRNNTLVILTTRQNFVWKSMEEIIPFIEDSWRQSALTCEAKPIVSNVDEASLGEVFKAVLQAEKIVVTAFNVSMANVLIKLRRKLGVTVPMVFYVHGFSSLGLWPMKNWGLLSVWQKNDQLITTSTRDYELLKHLIRTPNIYVVPFGFREWEQRENLTSNENMSFYYVGRISEQKNLHNLLWALSLLKDKKRYRSFTLDIFGEEDHLGSPNMGMKSEGYLEFLQLLTKELGLENHVCFHGFVSRREIQKKIRPGNPVFISPSLHSDENFGMAALRALGLGHYAILSDWGGHSDFKTNFPERVELIPVQVSKTGPFFEMSKMVEALEKVFYLPEPYPLEMGDSVYNQPLIIEKLVEIYEDTSSWDFSIEGAVDELARRWQEQFEPGTDNSQIFFGYEDPLFHRFSLFYAGQSELFHWEGEDEQGVLTSPLVKELGETEILINDPHRGIRELSFSRQGEFICWLLTHGYACSL